MKTYKISRTNLKNLHNIACTTWKTKLIDYAKRNPLDNDIELSEAEVVEMYKVSNSEQIAELNKYFELPKVSSIKSYAEACDKLGLKPMHTNPYKKLVTIIAALNDGWKPDFNNHDQKKYYPYFIYENGTFVFYYCDYDYWVMDVPSALYLKSEELALYAKDTFFELYKEYYNEALADILNDEEPERFKTVN